jgi:hypothetical protein
MRWAKVVLGIAATVGSVLGGVMVWIGFQLNSQGEMFDPETGTVHIAFVSMIFASWFIVAFVVIALSGATLIAMARLAKRLRSSSDAVAR